MKRENVKAGFVWDDPLLLEQQLTDDERMVREAARAYCQKKLAPRILEAFRHERTDETIFREMGELGLLGPTIPAEYGGPGLSLGAANAILEEIHRRGCNGAACHAQMYTMGTILRHGSEEQKAAYLPRIASGELRLQAFGITEPGSGTDTTRIRTFARRDGEPLHRERTKGVHFARRALGFDGAAGTHDAPRQSGAVDGWDERAAR